MAPTVNIASQAEAAKLIMDLDSHCTDLRAQEANIDKDITELHEVNYQGTASSALAIKWSGEVRPKIEQLLNESKAQQDASMSYYRLQEDTLQQTADAVNKI